MAALAAVGCGGGDDDDDDGAPPDRSSELALKGLNYDTDRELWLPRFVPGEIATIARDLHANAVILLGSDLERLTLAATAAADEGLAVWFEPRHFDSDAAETLDYVTTVARFAEELRADHPDVGLSLGVELTIFMDGLVPGASWDERAGSLGVVPPEEYNASLNRFLADALPTVRDAFGGQVTYSSGVWEQVDWGDFDIVGIDLYRDADNKATFAEDVRRLHEHGKPVVITEFGCCSFQGAEELGGSGFEVVDYTAEMPTVAEGVVRDEQVQADYIDELLDVFEAEEVHGAFVYDFIEPDSTYSDDPRLDFDMAGFAVVTCFGNDSEDPDKAYARSGHFEPKAAFATIARRFA
jgi:hypothetical protein